MTTITTGLFFVSRTPAIARPDPALGFVLTLHLIDNQGEHKKEPYVVRWTGEQARAFWTAHGALAAGTPLEVELRNPRSFMGGRSPEIHAQVVRCELKPARARAAEEAGA